eukprot:s823_g4.t1
MGRLTVVSTQQGSLLVRKSIKASSSTLHAVNCMGRLNVASTQVGRKRHILPCGNAFRRAAVWHAFCPVKEPVLLASRPQRKGPRTFDLDPDGLPPGFLPFAANHLAVRDPSLADLLELLRPRSRDPKDLEAWSLARRTQEAQ